MSGDWMTLEINKVYLGDCLEVMPRIEDSSINLIVVDPPYYKVALDRIERETRQADLFVRKAI